MRYALHLRVMLLLPFRFYRLVILPRPAASKNFKPCERVLGESRRCNVIAEDFLERALVELHIRSQGVHERFSACLLIWRPGFSLKELIQFPGLLRGFQLCADLSENIVRHFHPSSPRRNVLSRKPPEPCP